MTTDDTFFNVTEAKGNSQQYINGSASHSGVACKIYNGIQQLTTDPNQ